MDNLTIKISTSDLSMLRKIAKAQDRRFDDFVQLVFAGGLSYIFCDECVYVKKEPEDYTPEEQKQLVINNQLNNQVFTNYEEKEAAGYKSVSQCFSNHSHDPETQSYHDELIEPIVERIKSLALD